MTEKQLIRNEIKHRCQQHSDSFRAESSGRVADVLQSLEAFINAEVVVLYWSLKAEVFTHDLICQYADCKMILLPVMCGEGLQLKRFTSDGELECVRFGVMEPCGEPFTDYERIDLVVVPGVAFSRKGDRLGHGKGFYDRLLPKIKAPKVGICFDYQLLDQLPTEIHDTKMDMIIADNKLYV